MHQNYKDLIAKLISDPHEREEFFACYHDPLPKSIKIINHKITLGEFMDYTQSLDWKLEDPGFSKQQDSRYIQRENNDMALGKHRLHLGGFFYMQEIAASLAVQALDIQAGEQILDMCAAPGGKSVQIADDLLCRAIDSPGLVVSNEVSGSRIVALQSNLNRTGCYNSAVTQLDGTQFGNLTPEMFDKVLVDAPCSGEWTWFKSDVATKWRREENAQKIARLQYSLLSSAIKACKVWGTIVYATCTLNPRENEWVLTQALQECSGKIILEEVVLEGKSLGLTAFDDEMLLSDTDAKKVARFWPHRQHTGGFFIAKIHKVAATEHKVKKGEQRNKKSNLDLSPWLQKQMSKILDDEYGITIDPQKHFFAATNKQVYLISPQYAQLKDSLYVEKVGVPIFKYHNQTELHPTHGLWVTLGDFATQNVVALTDAECQKYSEWYDIPTDYETSTPHKYVILQREKHGFSVGKIVNNALKNKFQK